MKTFILTFLIVGLSFETVFFEGQKCSIMAILNHPKIVKYLHPETEGRKNLYIVENEFFTSEGITNDSVEVFTIAKNKKKCNKNYIEISLWKKTEKGRIFSFTYPIEGAVFNVHVDNNCEIMNIEIIEK